MYLDFEQDFRTLSYIVQWHRRSEHKFFKTLTAFP